MTAQTPVPATALQEIRKLHAQLKVLVLVSLSGGYTRLLILGNSQIENVFPRRASVCWEASKNELVDNLDTKL